MDLVVANNLQQLIQEPTHITETSAYLLDIIITDSPGYILDSGLWAPLGDPYHCVVFCKFQIQYSKEPNYKRNIWHYDRCDVNELKDAVKNAPWSVMDTYDNVNDAQQYFSALLKNICTEHIPHRSITVRPNDQPWMTEIVENR